MQKLLLTTLGVFIGFILQAQIVITQNEMPHSGDSLYMTRAGINPFLNYGATGANHVWNFTNLSATTQDSTFYQTVASTNFVYALTYIDLAFNPNRANHARPGVDIPFNNVLPVTNPYTFFYRSNSLYKSVGYGVELAGTPVPIIFSDHDEIYSLPLNYADADTTTSAYNISIPSLAYYGYEQTRMNEVDGWGIINTPSGTFDALRIKTTLLGRDTINLDSLGIGLAIERPVAHQYKWLTTNLRVPVMQVNTTEIFGIEIITDIWFYDLPRSITVAPPLANIICPGSTITLNYDVTGAFNTGGIFVPANVFTAQLSDSIGDFTNAVDIGTVTDTQSGTITCTIPANTAPGTGYRIRVISSSPAFTGEDNGFDLILGQPPVATATAGGVTEFCEGSSVLLSAGTDSTYSYQWQMDGSDISGATLPDIFATQSGDYTVTATNTCGSSVSAPITVIVNPLPEHTFAQASYLICDGDSVNIGAINVSGQSPVSYQWYLDGVLITGETNDNISASNPGAYSLEITNPITGCSFSSQVSLSIDSVPVPQITVTGNTSFCAGDSALLEIQSVPGMTYQWMLDGTMIPGATTTSLYASASGNYSAVATSSNGCTSESTPSAITSNPLPAPTVLSSLGDTTFCQGDSVTLEFTAVPGYNYQWTKNGLPVSGATFNQIIVTVDPGLYSVTATDMAGCSSDAANPILVTIDSVAVPQITVTGNTSFCAGDSALLEVPSIAGISYQWLLDGTMIPGANSTSLYASASGNYSVIATSLNGCTSESTPSGITSNPIPAPTVLSSLGDTTFCQGDSVSLEFTAVLGYNYQWTNNGLPVAGATFNQITVTADPGLYSVTATDMAGCSSDAVNPILVTINPLPAAPMIVQSYDTLYAIPGAGNLQWYVDGTLIPGATGSFYIPLVNGNYTVMISDSNGCENISTIYPMTNVGINEANTIHLSVHPNPSNGIFNLVHENTGSREMTYSIVDPAGRELMRLQSNNTTQVIDLSHFADGIYLLKIENADKGIEIVKIVKQQ